MKKFLMILLMGTILSVTSGSLTAEAKPNPYGPGVKACGSFRASYRIYVYAENLSCKKARKIQKELWNGPPGRKVSHHGGSGVYGYITLKRFPGWRCHSGSGGGDCTKGKHSAFYQN